MALTEIVTINMDNGSKVKKIPHVSMSICMQNGSITNSMRIETETACMTERNRKCQMLPIKICTENGNMIKGLAVMIEWTEEVIKGIGHTKGIL